MTSDAVCGALEAMLAVRKQWDVAPELRLLFTEDGEIRPGDMSLVPERLWSGNPPAQVLAGAAEVFAKNGQMLATVAPHTFAGAVFVCEMFMVADAAPEAFAAARARKLSSFPGRVETRQAWAVTCDGACYVASQARGEAQIQATRVNDAQGTVPQALSRIVQAVSAGRNC